MKKKEQNELTFEVLLEAIVTSGEKTEKILKWLECLKEIKPLVKEVLKKKGGCI